MALIISCFFSLFYSSYQGWDNPFRPEGELSHDAEEILRLWKEGRRDFSLLLNEAKEDDEDEEDDDENKNEMNNANDFKVNRNWVKKSLL